MSIVIVFSKIENGKHIKDLLTHNGFEVAAVHTTAAAALQELDDLESGLLISGVRLPDMFCRELRECMPSAFQLLLIGSPNAVREQTGEGIVALSIPLKAYELLQTVQMMLVREGRKRVSGRKAKTRSVKEQKIIDDAKQLLTERNHMSEEEAHRYLQKSSMDSGTNMVEAAQMIIALVEFS